MKKNEKKKKTRMREPSDPYQMANPRGNIELFISRVLAAEAASL